MNEWMMQLYRDEQDFMMKGLMKSRDVTALIKAL